MKILLKQKNYEELSQSIFDLNLKILEKDKVINNLLKRISDLEFEVEKQDKKIEKLTNIINELEKELNRGYRDLFEHELVPGRELITNIKNYLQELKGEEYE